MSDDLHAHEELCLERYRGIRLQLDNLEKRMWRLEGLIMISTITVIGATVAVITMVA